MTRMTIKPKALSETLKKYEEKFGHRPSAEAYKFSTDQEINDLASKALLDNQPVEDWESRPFIKTGTILDALYDDSVTPDAVENPQSSGKGQKVSKKELRKIAIAKEEARQWLAKREKHAKKDNSKKTTETSLPEKSTLPARDYSITHSNAQNLNWEVEKVQSKRNSAEQDTAEYQKKESYLESKKPLLDDRLIESLGAGLFFGLLGFLFSMIDEGVYFSLQVGLASALWIGIFIWIKEEWGCLLIAGWFFFGLPITAVLVVKLIG